MSYGKHLTSLGQDRPDKTSESEQPVRTPLRQVRVISWPRTSQDSDFLRFHHKSGFEQQVPDQQRSPSMQMVVDIGWGIAFLPTPVVKWKAQNQFAPWPQNPENPAERINGRQDVF